MKESYTGIGICHCNQCRFCKKYSRGKGKRAKKRAINKFRRQQLKLEEITKCNHFCGYWA